MGITISIPDERKKALKLGATSMPLFESREQQAGFFREFFSARQVPFLQRARRLIQEGLSLGERPYLGIGKWRASQLVDARAHVAL